MTHDELETEIFVNGCVTRFYRSGGKHLSAEEAVRIIRKSRLDLFGPVRKWFDKNYVRVRSYQRSATLELVRLIEESPNEDPIQVMFGLYSYLDDILGNANGGFTSGFASDMKEAVWDVIDLFRGKE